MSVHVEQGRCIPMHGLSLLESPQGPIPRRTDGLVDATVISAGTEPAWSNGVARISSLGCFALQRSHASFHHQGVAFGLLDLIQSTALSSSLVQRPALSCSLALCMLHRECSTLFGNPVVYCAQM